MCLDQDMMSRALLNLVTNAIDACKEKPYNGGETPRIDISFARKGGEFFFAVRDNGIGMDEGIRKRLFERFFSTKEAAGTGLGLCVTHKIIEEHEGTIQVESSPGKGSCFTIALPSGPPSCQAGRSS